MAIERLNVADKETLDNVNVNIGNTDDTGATDSTGTAMGKLNNIISKLPSIKNINNLINSRSIQPEIEDTLWTNYSSTSTQNTEIVNVTGKWEIMSMEFQFTESGTAKKFFIIEIDGVQHIVRYSRHANEYINNRIYIFFPHHNYGLGTLFRKSDNLAGNYVFDYKTDYVAGKELLYTIQSSVLSNGRTINLTKENSEMVFFSEGEIVTLFGSFRCKNSLKIITGSSGSGGAFKIMLGKIKE